MVVLIDCRATHNFISNKVVEKLNLPFSATGNYGLVMGTGISVRGKGTCKRV